MVKDLQIHSKDGQPIDSKGVGKKVLDRVQQTYDIELAGIDFAYDGEKILFTVGALPQKKMEFIVVLDDITSSRNTGNSSLGHGSPNDGDRKRMKCPTILRPSRPIANALRGQESNNSQEALRVLDIILRQHAEKQQVLRIYTSHERFSHHTFVLNNTTGVVCSFANHFSKTIRRAFVRSEVVFLAGCRGFHSSFRTTQCYGFGTWPSMEMKLSQGPWMSRQMTTVCSAFHTMHSSSSFSIRSIHFPSIKSSLLTNSLSLIILSRRSLSLILSRYRHSSILSLPQRFSRNGFGLMVIGPVRRLYGNNVWAHYDEELEGLNKDFKRMLVELAEFKALHFKDMYTASDGTKKGSDHSVHFQSSVLRDELPVLLHKKLKVGNSDDLFARNGRWNFNNKKFANACNFECCVMVNFSARNDIRGLIRDLIKFRRAPPMVRVDKMFEEVQSELPRPPEFLLCLLPERKE
ncbi:protein argonaute 4 [Phtheirospermum japonicum]|uniref:Protein argonaute 4 n=1 Tax=Phtheirospermum japonicum TaxID=374723 RepID=A0A830C2S5_9LAMI|nr:protein argonaute 4 [Phtheirospermum japonicum]